jgi:23S rRNA (cytosine1962-C5)-methyltransferase
LAGWFDLPEAWVLYQDDSVLVVDKPAGIVCQAVDDARPDDLPQLVKRRLAQQRGVREQDVYLGTHQRLDQATSGALLYTLDPRANAPLAEQFAARTIEKTYLAAVSGKPPAPGTLLVHWLAPAQAGRVRVAQEREPGAKQARTRVVAVRSVAGRSLLTLAIETGRTHQVRVQLAALGCPVAGDALYGGAPALRLLLHAQALRFAHPSSGAAVEVQSPPPPEFADWLAHGARDAFASAELLGRALANAIARRSALFRAYESGETRAFRLLHGAADGVDGFYVDVYDRWAVVRVDGDGRESDERALLAQLQALGFAGAYVKRHPKQANQLVDPTDEHVAPRLPLFGEAAPELLVVHEHAVPYEVRLSEGLRTGLFLDQRDNRARLRNAVEGLCVLNLFGYTGSFSVAALRGGASSVTTVDVSKAALAWAERNVARIGASERHRSWAEDAFVALASLAARGERFDCVIVDPPSYSTSKHGRFRAVKDYERLCVAALEVLSEGGSLLACLNHHGIAQPSLRRFVQAAAHTSGRVLVGLRDLPTPCDFPAEPDDSASMRSVLGQFGASARLRSPSAAMRVRKWRR